jgi:hypothetical protein
MDVRRLEQRNFSDVRNGTLGPGTSGRRRFVSGKPRAVVENNQRSAVLDLPKMRVKRIVRATALREILICVPAEKSRLFCRLRSVSSAMPIAHKQNRRTPACLAGISNV